MHDVASVRRAWFDYTSGVATIHAEPLNAVAVDGQLRRACLRQVLGGLDVAACQRIAAAGWWTQDTTATLTTLAAEHGVATDVAAARTAIEIGLMLAKRLRDLPWDVVFFDAERFVWLLPAQEQPVALRTFAVAHAILPLPRGDSAAEQAVQQCALALAHHASLERQEQFLTACSTVLRGVVRSDLLQSAAPLLTGERRRRALQEALAGAFEFPAGEVHRGQAVAAVVLRDPPALLGHALRVVRESWHDDDNRTELLFELARTLPPEHLGPILEEACALHDEWGRVSVLAEIQPRLPAALRERWQHVADGIRDETLQGILEPVVAEPPPLPGEQLALMSALQAWRVVASAGADNPSSAEIARGVVRFIEASAALCEAHREP